MAGDATTTTTTPDAPAMPAPTVGSSPVGESALHVPDVPMELVEEAMALVGGEESEDPSATPMEVDEPQVTSEDAEAPHASDDKVGAESALSSTKEKKEPAGESLGETEDVPQAPEDTAGEEATGEMAVAKEGPAPSSKATAEEGAAISEEVTAAEEGVNSSEKAGGKDSMATCEEVSTAEGAASSEEAVPDAGDSSAAKEGVAADKEIEAPTDAVEPMEAMAGPSDTTDTTETATALSSKPTAEQSVDAECKQDGAIDQDQDAVDVEPATDAKKQVDAAQEDTDVKQAPIETVADVDMTPVESDTDATAKNPEPTADAANGEIKNAESDSKPMERAPTWHSTDSATPADEATVVSSSNAINPEQVQVSEASGKRKEREEVAPSSPKSQTATAPSVVDDGEISTKKQKVEGTVDTLTRDAIKLTGGGDKATGEANGADASATTIAPPPIMISRDDMAKMEEDDGVLKFDVITNDGDPEHMVQLTTLKNIFAKQLPKMPKEYIVRLVFDRNHHSMVILKNGKHVIGGICYRPFLPNHFAEIAFCAINASDQVKGYGTRLMNHLKEYVKLQGITNFLTYADNYAIGYFKKQGFSKVVSMPRPNWFGYIKDYDGGTLMECTIHHQINYLRITSMVHKQRQAILDKIKQKSKAHIVYPGLTKFAEGRLLDIYMIPGVREAGWSQATIRNNRIGTRDPGSLKTQLTQLWKAVSSHRSAWPFHEPVDTNVVVDYLDYIKEPIDLTTIGKRVESGAYVSKAQFKADLDRMCTNCTVYNLPDTNYYKAAVDLQEFINKRVQVRDQPR